MLGPRPVIASLSLGATRTFRIKSMAPQADSSIQPSSSSSGQQELLASPAGTAQGSFESTGDISHVIPIRQSCMQDSRSSAIEPRPPEMHNSLQGWVGAAAQQVQHSCHTQTVASVDIQLPHNTLVVMWPPMQEAWKHEVSPVSQSSLPQTSQSFAGCFLACDQASWCIVVLAMLTRQCAPVLHDNSMHRATNQAHTCSYPLS